MTARYGDDHRSHHAHIMADFRKRFWISLALTVPVLALSPMIQDLIGVTAYNVIAIPLAAGVLNKTGFVMSPAAGAALMALSTVIVAINARFLDVKK